MAVFLVILLSGIVLFSCLKINENNEDSLRLCEVFLERTEEDTIKIVVVNQSDRSIVEKKIYLSDREDEPKKYSYENIMIDRKDSYELSMPYDPDRNNTEGILVCLFDENERLLDSVLVPVLSETMRYRWTGERWVMVSQDDTYLKDTIPLPEFSHESGFYDDTFELAISCREGLTIHYTLDCSIPDRDSPLYQSEIHVYDRSNEENHFRNIQNVVSDYGNKPALGVEPVEKAFVVRAVAYDEQGNHSDTVTKIYFVGLDQYKDCDVVCLTADPADLFDAETGIYVTGKAYDEWYAESLAGNTNEEAPDFNYMQKGEEWERNALFSFFEGGDLILDQEAGIRIQGHGARRSELKRFAVYARKKYSGSHYFDTDLFGNGKTHSIVLRRGKMHALMQSLCKNRNVMTMPYREVIVFLDGEYWYTTYMYEKASEAYIAKIYDVRENDVFTLKNGKANSTSLNGNDAFSEVYDYIKNNDLSKDDRYEGLCEIIDLQSYIDLTCLNAYMLNLDYRELWNNFLWRTISEGKSVYADKRWRWGLYDMDMGWDFAPKDVQANGNYYTVDPFNVYGKWQNGPITKWTLFSALRKNDTFCRQFVLTMMDMMNTDFKQENVAVELERLGMDDSVYSDFFSERPSYMFRFLREEFGLTGELVSLNVKTNQSDAGTVMVNTTAIDLSSGTWSGDYFTDYPVMLTALADEDHVFSYWKIRDQIVYDKKLELALDEQGTEVRAVFRKK